MYKEEPFLTGRFFFICEKTVNCGKIYIKFLSVGEKDGKRKNTYC